MSGIIFLVVGKMTIMKRKARNHLTKNRKGEAIEKIPIPLHAKPAGNARETIHRSKAIIE